MFSHLEGDALNIALLVPESRRATRVALVGTRSAQYGSPGRLADFRRQFEKTTRVVREDPSIFATTLETLAVKAFGDMGQTSWLRIIRDRFTAGHSCCELRHHLDSVAPETPIRNIVDCCRVWESHADYDKRWVRRLVPDRDLPIYTVNCRDCSYAYSPHRCCRRPLLSRYPLIWNGCYNDLGGGGTGTEAYPTS